MVCAGSVVAKKLCRWSHRCPRATYSKSPKDSFAQKEKQCWVQDVPSSGKTLKDGATFVDVRFTGV